MPTIKNCLSVLFYNLGVVKLNLHEKSLLVIDECLIYCKKARKPMQDPSNNIRKLKKIYDELRD